MPIFDYKCEKCEHEWEEIEFANNGQTIIGTKCPKCQSKNIKKLTTGGYFKLVYNNKTDVCSWGAEGYETSQYNRKDIDWDKGVNGLPNK